MLQISEYVAHLDVVNFSCFNPIKTGVKVMVVGVNLTLIILVVILTLMFALHF